MEELKTSYEWYKQLYPNNEIVIMDADGWDRMDYQYSYFEEKISLMEFMRRVAWSTCFTTK